MLLRRTHPMRTSVVKHTSFAGSIRALFCFAYSTFSSSTALATASPSGCCTWDEPALKWSACRVRFAITTTASFRALSERFTKKTFHWNTLPTCTLGGPEMVRATWMGLSRPCGWTLSSASARAVRLAFPSRGRHLPKVDRRPPGTRDACGTGRRHPCLCFDAEIENARFLRVPIRSLVRDESVNVCDLVAWCVCASIRGTVAFDTAVLEGQMDACDVDGAACKVGNLNVQRCQKCRGAQWRVRLGVP